MSNIEKEKEYLELRGVKVSTLVTCYYKGFYVVSDIKEGLTYKEEDIPTFTVKGRSFKQPNPKTHHIKLIQVALDDGTPVKKPRVLNLQLTQMPGEIKAVSKETVLKLIDKYKQSILNLEELGSKYVKNYK